MQLDEHAYDRSVIDAFEGPLVGEAIVAQAAEGAVGQGGIPLVVGPTVRVPPRSRTPPRPRARHHTFLAHLRLHADARRPYALGLALHRHESAPGGTQTSEGERRRALIEVPSGDVFPVILPVGEGGRRE